ncbi:unnamed protein product [Clonostachys rhizophaga]|uniref:small monomeric GTPase n=1 Tax=Clonostachys rhizophaga TaxID=160324 RepID=A0A9N9YT31_9HYPO|nr:unnamed protein product [Clonostachys rhizophaga]
MDAMRPSTPQDRIVLLGARGVGKNSLRHQYSDGVFGHIKKEFRHVPCRKIVTAAGQTGLVEVESIRYLNENGRHEILNNLKYTDTFLIVYSVTSRTSFEAAVECYGWIHWLFWSSRPGSPDQSQVPVMLVGNKNDLEGWREVSIGEGRKMARELGIGFCEVTARDPSGVKKLFHQAIQTSRQQKDGFPERQTADVSPVASTSSITPPTSHKKASLRSSRSRLSRLTTWRRSISSSRKAYVPGWDPKTDYGKNELQEGLVAAAKANDPHTFRSYAQAGAQLDGRAMGEKGSVVHIAAAAGHLQVLEVIIQREAGINLPDLDGIPPLQLAAVNGHHQCVNLLLQNGGDIDQTSPRYGTALSAAASRGHVDIVRLLLFMGAEVEVEASPFGNMMQRLSRTFDASIVQFLHEPDDDATTSSSLGEVPSHEALSRDVSGVTTPTGSLDMQLTKIEEVEDMVEGDSISREHIPAKDAVIRYSQESDSFEIDFANHDWVASKVSDYANDLHTARSSPIHIC